MSAIGRQRIVSVLIVLHLILAWLLVNAYAWNAPTWAWAANGIANVWFSARASQWLVRS
jgi:hypothetical protein